MTRENIVAMLKSYNAKKNQIELLRFELSNPPRVTEAELIDTLSLGSSISLDGNSNSGHISDKTMMIALQYKDAGNRLLNDTVFQISQELVNLESEVGRLEHYVSLISEQSSQIIRLYYFAEKLFPDISSELNLSKRTIVKYRDMGINELVEMYQYLERLKGDF